MRWEVYHVVAHRESRAGQDYSSKKLLKHKEKPRKLLACEDYNIDLVRVVGFEPTTCLPCFVATSQDINAALMRP